MAIAIRELIRANGEATQGLARRLGVGVTDAVALDHVLSSRDGLGPTELGHRLNMRSASATTLVDRLHAAGHVSRVPHPSDRRRQTVVGTEKAYREIHAALEPLLRGVEQAAGRLTPDQAAATVAFLTEVAAVLRDYAAEQRPA